MSNCGELNTLAQSIFKARANIQYDLGGAAPTSVGAMRDDFAPVRLGNYRDHPLLGNFLDSSFRLIAAQYHLHEKLMIDPIKLIKLAKKNEDAYSELPQEIEIDSGAAQLLIDEYKRYHTEKQKIGQKYKLISSGMRAVGGVAAAAVSMEPLTALSATAKVLHVVANATAYCDEIMKLDVTANPVVFDILQTYKLFETEPGKYTLRRGTWTPYRSCIYTGTLQIYPAVRVENVGIDQQLIPTLNSGRSILTPDDLTKGKDGVNK